MGEDPGVSVSQDAAQIGKMARTPEKCRCAGEGMRERNHDSCFLSHRASFCWNMLFRVSTCSQAKEA